MKVLALEGALGGFSVSVGGDGSVLSSVQLEGNVALEAGLPAVRDAMAGAAVEAASLDRLAVGIGPGGFTGLRIAIAYAKSLAQAWNLPLVGLTSFDILEYGHDVKRVLTVIVGRPGVISARYRDGEQTKRASGPVSEVMTAVLAPGGTGALDVLGAPEDVLAYLAEGGYTVNRLVPRVTPPAAALALAGMETRPAASLHEVRADYGEAPAAKIPTFRSTDRPKR